MSKYVRFEVLGTAKPQGSMKAFIDKGGDARMKPASKAMRPWRQEVGWGALRARSAAAIDAPFEGPVKLVAIFFFLKPKSAKKSRIHPEVKPDLDKLMRAVGDALTGVLYRDDAQVVTIVGQKVYGTNPRAEIYVERVP